MVKFATTLKESLEKAQPYKISNENRSENQQEASKALIIFIPGWTAELTEYYGLLNGIIPSLNQMSYVSCWEILPFKYDNWFFSEAEPDEISQALVTAIKEYFNPKYGEKIDYINYNKVFLLGHSFGGLIARKSALIISKNHF